MKKNKIFIITSSIDYPVDRVTEELNLLGYEVLKFDIDLLIEKSSYLFRFSDLEECISFKQKGNTLWNGNVIPDIHSVWDTGTLPIADIVGSVAGNLDFQNPDVLEYLKTETTAFVHSFLNLFSDKFWVNHYLDSLAANSKISNLILAKQLGLKIPKTLISNSRSEIELFLESIETNAIVKTFCFFEFLERKELKVCFATKRTREEILDNLGVIYYPIFLQKYIDKTVELRVVVIGREVFSVAIHSQSSVITQDDWRASDVSKLKHEIYQIPNEIELKILKFCEVRNLKFAAFDFIVDTQMNIIFLECNPQGEWYWLEEETGVPLAKSIANLLANHK